MFDKQGVVRPCALSFVIAVILGLSACGGGGGAGGSNVRPSPPPPSTGSGDTNVNVDGGTTTIRSEAISGAGALIKGGAGTLVLTDTNTYTGGTKINAGTLQIGNGGTIGSIVGDVTDSGALVFDRSDAVNFNGIVSGSGSLEQAGKGTLILTGANTYIGGTTISNGTLQLGNGGTAGSIVGDVTDNGSLVFNRSNDMTFDGVVSGSGSLEQAGKGTLTLTGTNTYTGGTAISNGTLQLGDGNKTGSIVGDVTDNGSMVFDPSDDLTYKGIINGSGSLVKSGKGTLTLTGASTYTGGTKVLDGTLEMTSAATLGPGIVTVGYSGYNDATLRLDNSISLSNQIVLNTATLDNEGLLVGNTDNAAVESGDGYIGTVLNHDGGSIKAKNVAVIIDGMVKNSVGSIIDGGTIGVEMNPTGTVSNDGIDSIISSPKGIAVRFSAGGSATSAIVENTDGGTITGGTTAIYLTNGGEVTNGSGSIIKTIDTGGGCQDSGGCSIYVPTATSISDDALTLTNAGRIIGDVQADPEAFNSATLLAGSSIQGDLDMGPHGSLTLKGDAGTIQLYSQAVTGTTTFGGMVTKAGDGTWIIDTNDLLAESPGQFSALITGGTLQMGTGGTTGAIAEGGVDITRNGSLVFDRSDDVTFAGHIEARAYSSGIGVLVQAGTGTLTLTSSDIAPDKIKIENGTLQIGNGGTGPTQIGSDIVNDGSFVIDTSGNLFIPEAISGTGSLTKRGTGTLFLTERNFGAELSSYTGGTAVEGGILQAGQLIPGDVSVGAAGTLDGVPGVAGDLSNAGTVAVHDGYSTPVNGNYTQASTGTLAVSLGSKLNVAGSATLNGGTLEVTGADRGYTSNTHTDVLTASGGVSGTFDKLVKDASVVFTATTIHYDANSVWLDTTGLNVTTAAAGHGVSYTPASMGSAVRVQGAFEQLDGKMASSSSDNVSKDFVQTAGQFQRAPNLRAAQASLESLSGQLHAASAGMTLQAIDATGRALSERLEEQSPAQDGKRQHTWMRSLTLGGDMARNGFANVDYQLNGWLVGSDTRLNQHTLAGFAFSQGEGVEQLPGRFDRNRSRSTAGMFYLGWTGKRWYAHGRVGMGQYHQQINRMLLLGTRYQGVWTDYDGHYNVAYGESGLHLGLGSMRLTPFVDMEYDRVARNGFSEQGAGGFGLKAGSQLLQRWQSGLGVKLKRQWNLAGGRSVGFDARAQWRQTLSASGAAFDASFVGFDAWQPLTGVGLSRRNAVFGLNFDAKPSTNTRIKLGYEYLIGDRGRAGVASAHFSLAF